MKILTIDRANQIVDRIAQLSEQGGFLRSIPASSIGVSNSAEALSALHLVTAETYRAATLEGNDASQEMLLEFIRSASGTGMWIATHLIGSAADVVEPTIRDDARAVETTDSFVLFLRSLDLEPSSYWAHVYSRLGLQSPEANKNEPKAELAKSGWWQRMFGWVNRKGKSKNLQDIWMQNPPPLSGRLVLASHRYDPGTFNCEVVADTALLRNWLKDLYQDSSKSFWGEVLLNWLGSANLSDPSTTYVLDRRVLSPLDGYEPNLCEAGVAIITCGTCHSTFRELLTELENFETNGHDVSGTFSWKCPQGHLLYQQTSGGHVSTGATR